MKSEGASCEAWVKLLRSSSEDPAFVALLQDEGLKAPRAGQYGLGDSISANGGVITLSFVSPAYLKDKIVVTKKSSVVLNGVTAHLASDDPKQRYSGSLPFSIGRGDSPDQLIERLGKPKKQNKREHWMQWRIEGLDVLATFSSDFRTLESVSVHLQDK